MYSFSSAYSALTSLYEAAPMFSSFVATALGTGYGRADCPPEDLLPKGLSYFKHSVFGINYHGIQTTIPDLLLEKPNDAMDASSEEFPMEAHPGDGLTIVHCAHGFGASSLSFANLLQQVQERQCKSGGSVQRSVWVAHDTLGFGFTTADLSLSSNGEHPVDVQQRLYLDANSGPTISICQSLRRGAGTRQRVVFLGHSMGSISAIHSAYRWHQEGHEVGAVVLLAPAISMQTIESANANHFLPAASPLLQSLTRVTKVWHLLPCQARRTVLAALLRLAVALDLFWYIGLRFALGWHQEVELETMEQYKCPMARDNWAPWLVAFIESNLIPSLASSEVNQKKASPSSSVTLRDMLRTLVDSGVKVLIIHDPSDTFIPFRNSEEIAKAFSGHIALEVALQHSGHIIHEVVPECILDAMAKHDILV